MNRSVFMLLSRKLLLLILMAGLCAPVFARKYEEDGAAYVQEEGRRYSEKRRGQRMRDHADNIGLDEAVSRVRSRTNGRVLSAEESESEYRIRIITKGGKVRRLRVDPATGEIIRRNRGGNY